MSKPSKEELVLRRLLLRAEQLQNASPDIDEDLRRHIEKSGLILKEDAAREVTGDKDPKDALRRFDELMKFLLQPAGELTSDELEFRNELLEKKSMSANYLASLLRIYEPDVLYKQFCAYLSQYVWSKWDSSSVKKSRVAKKSSKKDLKPSLSDHGKKPPEGKKKERDLRGRFTRHRKKDTDLGQI